MTLQEYQDKAMTTCMQTCYNIPYMLLNLQGEVGELSSKLAKFIRKDKLHFETFKYVKQEYINHASKFDATRDEMHDLKAEAGDILWQLSGLCSVLNWSLNDVAQQNLDKLASRMKRHVIDGDGDHR